MKKEICEGCQGKGYLDKNDGYDYGKVVCPICVNDEEPKKAKRSYSEEEVLELLWKREWSYEHSMPFITVDDWFEQNKKK